MRSAHLERLALSADDKLLYVRESYDLEPNLKKALAARAEQCGAWRILMVLLATRGPLILELNEPLMIGAWPLLITCQMGVLGRRFLRRGPTIRTTYAIENLSPEGRFATRCVWFPEIAKVMGRAVCRFFICRVDRLVFGTEASRRLYGEIAPKHLTKIDAILVPAIPARCQCGFPLTKRPGSFLFVGEFSERKGLRKLLQAWDSIESHSGLSLTLIGNSGDLSRTVKEWAQQRSSVRLLWCVPRWRVHQELASSGVLVLLSETKSDWREQIGLPILEALAHGCEVIASDATGIAGELENLGHRVLPESANTEELVTIMLDLSRSVVPASKNLAKLPREDGRLEAERVMHSRAT